VHFILSGQEDTYPSLNQVAEHYKLGTKLDTVKEDYWKNGIDTPMIPLDILTEYLVMDLTLTEQIYLKQNQQLSSASPEMKKLVSLSCQDLLVLLEMETNGLKVNFSEMKEASITINQQIETIKGELNALFSNVPSNLLNYNSNDVLSALLYGGKIQETIRELIGVYKTGSKLGQPRYSISYHEHLLPRRYEPPRGSELKKEGYFATNEETLRNIKTSSSSQRLLLDKILKLSKLEKLTGTYYEGLTKLHMEKDWEQDYIHGQFNQCVARTGRLSSSSPNLQNFPPEVDKFIITRY
ncbi:MAG: DNA polymerase, partial [archaeon]|nr:DNA polymerase [archaeon]